MLGNTTKSTSPEPNEIVGVKYSAYGCFYRAKVTEKTDENTYAVLFIDFGFEEIVNITDIVTLPEQLQQVQFS